ncbi:glycosyltransferase family 1 protein [uncultured Limnobacter sp.]|uniref:glycosyltransferase family 4 protein n=1 Tax=uncultured Limnobacter sp. TaxID=199681 RepID=UPI0030F7685B
MIYEPIDCQVSKWFEGFENVSARETPIPSSGGRIHRFSAGIGYWGNAFKKDSFDIFEAMHLPLVRTNFGRSLLTIHDVRGLHSENGLLGKSLFAHVLRKSLQQTNHVVTVSEAMRNEILQFFPEASVSVVYNGLDQNLYNSISTNDCQFFLKKYNLSEGFLLAVGHLESRKNYSRLIESLVILKSRGIDCPLVIVGHDSGEGKAIRQQIDASGLKNSITLLTGLSDVEVRCAYLMCGLFVFPSLYEGFGIPILEAMAAKRPMVLSKLPVFEEITQGQSIYFSPTSEVSMADAIGLGLSSSSKREQMIQFGCERVINFDFDSLAEKMAKVYRSI